MDKNTQVINGDIVLMHDSNWNYPKRIGSPYKAIILWRGMNGQPLCLRYKDVERGIYNPMWGNYENIIEITGHIDLENLVKMLKPASQQEGI